ncbi:MAG: hypothetical protein L6Q75_03845 [Burkholderiaceae bacterium]|nr:hypothetical protein [Burkholderiaceae bacterium]
MSPYLLAGMPAPSRVWVADDYVRAQKLLAAGQVALPSLADPHGAALLRRMTAAENLTLYRNRAYDLQIRAGLFATFIQAWNAMAKQLMSHHLLLRKTPSSELAMTGGFGLRTMALAMDLAGEQTASTDPSLMTPVHREGVRRIRAGVVQAWRGMMLWLDPASGFAAADRSVLLKTLADTLPSATPAFDAEVRYEYRRTFTELRAHYLDVEDRLALDILVAGLGS